jgi:cytochrome P450
MDQMTHCIFDYNTLNLWRWINPYRHFKIFQNNRNMHNFLQPIIEQHIESDFHGQGGVKTIVGLALKTHTEELGAQGSKNNIDKPFMDALISQLKIFIFAGHDTTATTVGWILYCLSQNPEVLEKVRTEHNEVFGNNVDAAFDRLREIPQLLQSIPYTTAVIKETLRMFPSPGSIRDGCAGFSFLDPDTNMSYPTDGFMIWDGIRAASLSEDIWVRPDEFLPQRWLVDADDPLYPLKTAWRPFSIGPRNCIGQELAMAELKLVVVSVAREFDIECAWSKWDEQQ